MFHLLSLSFFANLLFVSYKCWCYISIYLVSVVYFLLLVSVVVWSVSVCSSICYFLPCILMHIFQSNCVSLCSWAALSVCSVWIHLHYCIYLLFIFIQHSSKILVIQTNYWQVWCLPYRYLHTYIFKLFWNCLLLDAFNSLYLSAAFIFTGAVK